MNAYCLNDEEVAIVTVIPTRLKKELMIHGIYEGCQIMKIRSAPFFDPVIYQVGQSLIALRKIDAEELIVEKVV